MDTGDSGGEQLFGLTRGELDTDFKLPGGVVGVFLQIADELWRQLGTAERGDTLDLCAVGHREQAWDERGLDAECFAAIAEGEEVGVVVEELGDDGIGTGVDFALEIFEIGLGAGGLLMGFGVASNGDAHFWKFVADEFDQLIGVGETAGGGFKLFSALRRIAAKGHYVVDAQLPGLGQIVAELVGGAADACEVGGDW